MARRSPTTFVVRISIDREKGTVVWFEDVHDADGDLGRTTKTWDDCVILDDNNWRCEPGIVLGQPGPEAIEMRDGELFQRYWNENRNFETRRKVFGVGF
jgi:hypothetical protein